MIILVLILGIGAAVVVAILGLVVVRRRIPLEVLEEQHEVAGICFAVVGGLYGIILAFVMVASWQRFETARHQTEIEANALTDVYRLAPGFREPARAHLMRVCKTYAHAVIDREWPAMIDHELSHEAQDAYLELWHTVLSASPTEASEISLYQVTLGTLERLGDARRDRMTYMRTGIPSFIWDFLVVIGGVTVAFTYFFGMRRLLPQALITGVLAAAIAWALVLVHEMQVPFSGAVRVPDRAFHVALRFMGEAGEDGETLSVQ